MRILKKIDWENLILDNNCREDLIDTICRYNPCIHRGTLTKSLCGRDIDCLEIGNQDDTVLFVGAFHGTEWLTSLLLIRLATKISNAVQNKINISSIDIASFLKRKGVVIIPCINPDGVEISLHSSKAAGNYRKLVHSVSNGDTSFWQANAKGVDLNHNFDANWEELHELEKANSIVGASPTRYGGAFPESEPETRALANLCRSRYFRHALAFHSQGEEIYWRFGDTLPKKLELMANIMASSSGYKLSDPEGLAEGGGFKDWFISYFNRPAFTIEIGKGKNPLPVEDLDHIYNQLEEMLILSIIM